MPESEPECLRCPGSGVPSMGAQTKRVQAAQATEKPSWAGLNPLKGQFPRQVVAVDRRWGRTHSLVYSIQPPNKFYSLNSSTGKIRFHHVMLDWRIPTPTAELMRKSSSLSRTVTYVPLRLGCGP